MLIVHDPDAYVATSTHYTCPFHEKNPDIVSYAGCSCSSSWGARPATEQERRANRERRLDRERRLREWFNGSR